MKLIVVVFTLLTGVNAYSATAWEHFSSGDGTAFEERWVGTTAIESMSSDEKLASDLILGASLNETGGLFVWVSHASSELCKFSDWKLAVDKTVFSIESDLAEDTKATALHPVDEAESMNLLKLFREGEKVAVRFHANCDNMFYLNYIGTATMTYSLDGSSAALDFLAGGAPRTSKGGERHIVPDDSPAMAAYQFAIAQKIRRNWSVPSSASPDTLCVASVRQVRGGEIVAVNIISCNGDDAVRRSVEAAVMRASPLPEPPNPDLFRAELEITLRPEP